ncbi:hypothetical protein GON03_00740 [Nocardioides sp. MAH-18]|uniref:DUF4367 domain-containing protein n=1 Tax=Nocardioides agri TaxID=2682843 RepID=A0A6L6XKR2_9ACTN|nr:MULTISPECIES: hypothetical protein [unclassified Nocardioides]MBA2956543.1 hypothetical protein [Nocardioides sp. CGMCC 1.13656]MVQ47690.1 hypothetical protein [Nocardioides sp. MAH-18]
MSDTLEQDLRALAGDLRVPEPGPALAGAVLARVAVPPPARGRVRWVVAVAVAVLLAGLAASPVGARVVEWFDFHGVMVREDDTVPGGTPAVPSEPGASLEGAAFDPLVPAELGPPDGVGVSDGGDLVSMSWTTADGTVRIDEFAAGLDPYFWKSSPVAQHVDVDGRDAIWFPVPHEVVVVPEGGAQETHAPRLAGQTLVVPVGAVTVRIEGEDLDLVRAVEIAASLE